MIVRQEGWGPICKRSREQVRTDTPRRAGRVSQQRVRPEPEQNHSVDLGDREASGKGFSPSMLLSGTPRNPLCVCARG